MSYLSFDVLAVALPAALLLFRATGVRLLLGPVAALGPLALLWTAPWDDHLVRTGVWAYDPAAVLGRVGAVPVEEYAFVLLEVLLVGAFALRTGTLSPPPTGTPSTAGARHQGARVWVGVAGAGGLLLLAGGHLRYLGLLLVWAAAPLALQHLVAGDVLQARWSARLRTAGPVALWLCVADRLAIAHGTWTISPASSTGVSVLGLPVEEALFFALTCLLVTDGLLLLADPAVRRRVTRRRSAHGRTGRSSRSSLTTRPRQGTTPANPPLVAATKAADTGPRPRHGVMRDRQHDVVTRLLGGVRRSDRRPGRDRLPGSVG